MNTRNFDLNLLRVFAAVDTERHVSRAAVTLGLSQPAMSNALFRLRRACDDPLFVRTRTGMEPTALAQEMAQPVREALAQAERALQGPAPFDPATVERTFRLLLSDVGEMALLPALMQLLAGQAPGVRVEALQLPHDAYADALKEGRADLAIGHLSFLGAGFYQQRLFDDSYCCIASQQHAQLRGRVGIAQFVAAQHVAVASGNADAQVDKELARGRRGRTVALRVTHYRMAVEVVAATALIAVVPRRAVRAAHGVQVLRLPFALPPARVRQFWHRRVHQDPANRWLRGHLLGIGGEG